MQLSYFSDSPLVLSASFSYTADRHASHPRFIGLKKKNHKLIQLPVNEELSRLT